MKQSSSREHRPLPSHGLVPFRFVLLFQHIMHSADRSIIGLPNLPHSRLRRPPHGYRLVQDPHFRSQHLLSRRYHPRWRVHGVLAIVPLSRSCYRSKLFLLFIENIALSVLDVTVDCHRRDIRPCHGRSVPLVQASTCHRTWRAGIWSVYWRNYSPHRLPRHRSQDWVGELYD